MPINLDEDKVEEKILVPEKKVTVTYNKIKTISINYNYETRQAVIMYERYLKGVLIEENLNFVVIENADFTSVNGAIPNSKDTLGKQLKMIMNTKIKEMLNLVGDVV